MKARTVLLPASIAANALLLAAVVFQPSIPGLRRLGTSPAPAALPEFTAPTRTASPSADVPAGVWPAIESTDLAVFTANLRAVGLPDRLVRILINAEINERYRAREAALRPPRPQREFWETRSNHEGQPATLEARLELLDIRREKNALRRELLGDSVAAADSNPIPRATRELVRQIGEDYSAMIQQIRADARDFLLPADEEKIRYLESERAQELAELLTPDQLREHELRSDQVANNLRSNLSAFRPDEAEFRLIYELQKELDTAFPNNRQNPPSDFWDQRRAAQNEMNEQLKAALGDERHREYLRSQDHHYRNLTQLAARFDLPAETPARIYDQRDASTARALDIFRNADLSAADKRAAFARLAAESREQLTARLGAEAAEAYLARTQNNWITQLEEGRVTEQLPNNSSRSHRLPNR